MKLLKIALINIILFSMFQNSNAGSADSYDDFAGTFVIVKNAAELNIIKIEKHNGEYVAREWAEDQKIWGEMFRIEKAEEILSGSPEFRGVIGFHAGMSLMVRVPVGWRYGRYTAKTGFALISDVAGKDGVDLYKK